VNAGLVLNGFVLKMLVQLRHNRFSFPADKFGRVFEFQS